MQNRSIETPSGLTPQDIRRIFHEWDSLKALSEDPLADLALIRQRRRTAGNPFSSLSAGMALREVIQAGLEALKPDGGSPDLREKRWRQFVILTEQYIHGRNPDWVIEQLHVSKGTYYGEQTRALQRLAEVLQRWEDECQISSDQPEHASVNQAPNLAPPRPPYALVGRDELLFELKQVLLDGSNPVSIALEGLPGVGKTAIAVELTRDPEITARYADGVLWASLGRQPDLLVIISAWEKALGIPSGAAENHRGIQERAAAIHTVIGARRILVVIDDAWQSEDSLAFKLGGPNCAYLVTTRQAGVGVDFAGDRVYSVHELDPDDGQVLLAQIAPRAFEGASSDFPHLVELVGGLPLALILIGRYIQKVSYKAQTRRMRAALASLEAPEMRMMVTQPVSPLESALSAGPGGMSVSLQTVIGLSDKALDSAARQALCDLALFPPKPNSFSEEGALAVIGGSTAVLDRLVDSGLVEAVGSDRYTLHQTIADYAGLEGRASTSKAGVRLIDYSISSIRKHIYDFSFLDQELTNILAVLDLCVKTLQTAKLGLFASLAYPYLETRGLYHLCDDALTAALRASQATGDLANQAALLYNLGNLEVKRGHFKSARDYLQRCLPLAQAINARELEADAWFQIGLANQYSGILEKGKNSLVHAREIHQKLGATASESFDLCGLGYIEEELGNYGSGLTHLSDALRFSIDSHNRRGEGWAHYNMSMVYLPMGDFQYAMRHAEECHRIYLELDDRRGLGWLYYHRGRIHRQMGEYQQAEDDFSLARQIFTAIGDWMGIGFAIQNQGLIAAELGHGVDARQSFLEAMHIFRRIECLGLSQSENALGVLSRREGDYASAEVYFLQSMRYMREMRYRRGEARNLIELGLNRFYRGDSDAALENIQEGMDILEEISALPNLALALTYLGHVQAGCGRHSLAEGSYQRALELREKLEQPTLALEPKAGLTRLDLLAGRTDQATRRTEEMLPYMHGKGAAVSAYSLAGLDQPLWVAWTCCEVLSATGDTRAEALHKTTVRLFKQRLAQVADGQPRKAFVENVPIHLAIWQFATAEER
jgi:tetratricopeptide (TPR) repeat protein